MKQNSEIKLATRLSPAISAMLWWYLWPWWPSLVFLSVVGAVWLFVSVDAHHKHLQWRGGEVPLAFHAPDAHKHPPELGLDAKQATDNFAENCRRGGLEATGIVRGDDKDEDGEDGNGDGPPPLKAKAFPP